jgi:hypothetical protein
MHRDHRSLMFAAFVAAALPAQARNVFFVGHSLINFTMPHILQKLADSGPAVNHSYREQIINGSPLIYNWENGENAQGYNARLELLNGTYDALVVTEAVPLQNHLTWSNTYVAADNYYDLATNANAASRVYIYETWHCVNSGMPAGCAYDDGDDVPWRQRLTSDLPKWEGIADTVNQRNTGPDMLVIPGGQALAALHDAIQAGNGGGLGSIGDVFADDIHLNNTGWYYIACVMYATLYARSPEGLTNAIEGEYGGNLMTLSPALAQRLQELAWQTVSSYPKAFPDGAVAVRRQQGPATQASLRATDCYTLTGRRLRDIGARALPGAGRRGLVGGPAHSPALVIVR